MTRTLIAMAVFITSSNFTANAAGPKPGSTLNVTCTGELDTGSGMAGSRVGEKCFLSADSESEHAVQKACPNPSVCNMTAIARVTKDGSYVIKKIISVTMVQAPAQ